MYNLYLLGYRKAKQGQEITTLDVCGSIERTIAITLGVKDAAEKEDLRSPASLKKTIRELSPEK